MTGRQIALHIAAAFVLAFGAFMGTVIGYAMVHEHDMDALAEEKQ